MRDTTYITDAYTQRKMLDYYNGLTYLEPWPRDDGSIGILEMKRPRLFRAWRWAVWAADRVGQGDRALHMGLKVGGVTFIGRLWVMKEGWEWTRIHVETS